MLPGRTGGSSPVNPIRQFTELPARERQLLFRAFALVAAVRLALWTIPFRLARRLFATHPAVSPALAQIPVERLTWAVRAAARRIPEATCLTQAVALHRLARTRGPAATSDWHRQGWCKEPVCTRGWYTKTKF